MNDEDALVQALSDAHPGYAPFIEHLETLACTYPPPFVYVTDAQHARLTAGVIDALFRGVAGMPGAPPTLYVRVNAVACITPRVFYDTVLNGLAGWQPAWADGCTVWPGEDGERYNDSIDGFLHGLRRLRAERMGDLATQSGKGKNRADADAAEKEPSMVLLVERAERLAERLPELVVPLSRLAELSRVKIAVILLSSVGWDDIRPGQGASPEPYYLDVAPLGKQEVVQRLVSAFHQTSLSPSSSHAHTYHPALQPLYAQYAETLCDAVGMYTTDPVEIQYLAAARWPGFVAPVIREYEELVRQAEEEGEEVPELEPPGTAGRLRLLRHFLPTLTGAMEVLLPRLDNAADWAARHADADAAGGEGHVSAPRVKLDALPRMSKFILVAAYVASTNPAKTDLRLFGRGPAERKRRRRKSGSPRKGGGQSVVKVSQRLLGPAAFPLDRLLAILGALLEEHDEGARPHDPRFQVPGEYTDMEVGRVHVYAAVGELTLMRLLHRTSTVDRLDGPPTFKCGISHDVALGLAREVDVGLNELLWDPA